MSDVKHTPRPWSVVYYDAGDTEHYDHNGSCPSIQADDHDCAVVHWDGFKQEYWSSANGNQNQIEANARLIAAAPDLLEALHNTLSHAIAWQGEPNEFSCDVHRIVVAEARAAIAKATGADHA